MLIVDLGRRFWSKYSRDCGWPRRPWPNAGRKSRKNARKSVFFVKNKNNLNFFLHISFSYAKILGETNFCTREIPRSGSKAEDGEKKERRAKVGDNNSQATHGARKHAWCQASTEAAQKHRSVQEGCDHLIGRSGPKQRVTSHEAKNQKRMEATKPTMSKMILKT